MWFPVQWLRKDGQSGPDLHAPDDDRYPLFLEFEPHYHIDRYRGGAGFPYPKAGYVWYGDDGDQLPADVFMSLRSAENTARMLTTSLSSFHRMIEGSKNENGTLVLSSIASSEWDGVKIIHIHPEEEQGMSWEDVQG